MSVWVRMVPKALRVMDNLERILAIELMNASQAIEYRRPLQSVHLSKCF
jgi:histidine ammonia-lyase